MDDLRTAFAEIARERGFALDDSHLEVLTTVGRSLLADFERLDTLSWGSEPERPADRAAGHRPSGEDNPVNGWVWRCTVRGAASGPLAGREVALKDTIALAGHPLLNGSEAMEGFVPSFDATVVERLLAAGATIVGKTAVPAFCCEGAGLIGYPEPLPVNPRDPSRLPGGSSSGSAAVVVNGEVDMALGGDQGGSIRVPASWCGCVGLKPTFGLVPYTGIFPVEMTLDTVGPMTRTVADCAAVLEAIAGPDGDDPRQAGSAGDGYVAALSDPRRLRVGVLAEGFGTPAAEPAVDAAVREIAARLQERGHAVVEVGVPAHRDGMAIWNAICLQGLTALLLDEECGTNWRGAYPEQLGDFMRMVMAERAAQLPDTVKVTMLCGEHLTRTTGLRYYARAQNLGRLLTAAYDAALESVDVLLMPTTPMRAPERPADVSPEDLLLLTIGLESADNVAPFNVSGHPSLSVPCADVDGLPVGAMVVGRRFDDATVLLAGAEIERAARD